VKIAKTNAVRLLERLGVRCEWRGYEVDPEDLTAETVARWLASRLAGGLGLLEEEAVEIVMRHEEGTHAYVVMDRGATVEDALTAFDDHLHSGNSLDAIILSHSGRGTEQPLGIVAVSDIPRLLGAVRA
jgi:hypothetical protein